ncbi:MULTISPECIES: hypothetical protein [Kitasatospora]|uniref:WXG100 family type VII secretion target n=1 Tax=Kitasatospora arboriphila TaxID=258052 RepID=A0ABP4DRW9_9ACTN
MGILDGIGRLLADAELSDLAGELEALANEVSKIAQELERARHSVHWTGAAADAFQAHAEKRIKDLHGVVGELEGAASASKAVAAVGGLL